MLGKWDNLIAIKSLKTRNLSAYFDHKNISSVFMLKTTNNELTCLVELILFLIFKEIIYFKRSSTYKKN